MAPRDLVRARETSAVTAAINTLEASNLLVQVTKEGERALWEGLLPSIKVRRAAEGHLMLTFATVEDRDKFVADQLRPKMVEVKGTIKIQELENDS